MESDKTRIREKVFEQINLDDLEKGGGLDSLIQFMDKQLGKDDLVDSLEKFKDFEDFERSGALSITDYIALFDQKCQRLSKINTTLSSSILAFKLLKRATITKEEKILVLTGMDFDNRDKLFHQAKTSLKKFLTDATVKSRKSAANASI